MKRLKIKVQKTQWGHTVRIIEQTHRCLCFGANGETFSASNGFLLKSIAEPAVVVGSKTIPRILFLRGKSRRKDKITLVFPNYVECDAEKWAEDLSLAVREYNEVFRD